MCGREAGGRSRVLDHGLSNRRNQGRHSGMAEVKVFYDREGKTLTVWFTERSREYVCEETGEEVVPMKDAGGHVIVFEKLNFWIPQPKRLMGALEPEPSYQGAEQANGSG